MEDFVALVLGDVTCMTYLTVFTVMIRLICICLIVELVGVVISHLASIGR